MVDHDKEKYTFHSLRWKRYAGERNIFDEGDEKYEQKKFDIYLLCNQGFFSEKAERVGVHSYRMDIPEIMIDGNHMRLQIIQCVKTIFEIVKLIKKHRIDLVYCNNGLPSQTAYYASKIMKVPIVSHIRSKYSLRYIWLYRLHKVMKLVFVSRSIRSQFMDRMKLCGNTEVVYNSVDTMVYSPVSRRDPQFKNEFNIGADKIVIGQVGSLIYRKGIDVLLKAFSSANKQYDNIHLLLAGSGQDEEAFREMATELRLQDRVTFVGEVSNPVDLYKHVIDINVLASRSEAFGVSLIEGAACGLPSIGANVDGIPEIISDGFTGFLFESGDEQMLAQKIVQLVSDRVLRSEMGERGLSLVQQKFALEKYINSVENIIDSLTSNVSSHGVDRIKGSQVSIQAT